MGQLGRSKAMRLLILSLARDDLREIFLYLLKYGENPSRKFRKHFEQFCTQVVDMPSMFGQYEHNPSYRKAAIIFDYLIFYKVDEVNNKIMIYRILHGKRNVKSLLN